MRLKDKFRHIMAMRTMTRAEMFEYLRSVETYDSVVWQQLAARVAESGPLPGDLHNRMLLESGICAAKRAYVEGLL